MAQMFTSPWCGGITGIYGVSLYQQRYRKDNVAACRLASETLESRASVLDTLEYPLRLSLRNSGTKDIDYIEDRAFPRQSYIPHTAVSDPVIR